MTMPTSLCIFCIYKTYIDVPESKVLRASFISVLEQFVCRKMSFSCHNKTYEHEVREQNLLRFYSS